MVRKAAAAHVCLPTYDGETASTRLRARQTLLQASLKTISAQSGFISKTFSHDSATNFSMELDSDQ
jgi:hypothetical protein